MESSYTFPFLPSGYRSACTVLMASVRKLRQAEIQLLKEDHLYICGGTIFTEDSDIKACCMEPFVNCSSKISVHYYSCCHNFQLYVWQLWWTCQNFWHYQSMHPTVLSAKQMATLNALVGLGKRKWCSMSTFRYIFHVFLIIVVMRNKKIYWYGLTTAQPTLKKWASL